jgi:Na+/H+-dicarboxylate symporter
MSFVQLLKALVAPLVLTAIIASIERLRELNNAARLAGQTLLWFAITALIAVAIGIVLGLVFQPGITTTVAPADAAAPHSVGSWLDFLKRLIPSNFLGLAASTDIDGTAAKTSISFNVLQLVVIGLALGFAALRTGEAGTAFLNGAGTILAVVRKLLAWVVKLAPIGTAGLIGNAVVKYGWGTQASIGQFALALYVGLGLVLFVVYPLLLRAHGLNPMRYFAKAWPAIELAFVSRSSIAALPVTEAVTIDRLGVPASYGAFAVPVGATTKMDGRAAVYPALSAIFIAQFYHVALVPIDYLLIVLVSVLGSAATAGVTGATVMLTLTLSTLGLPLEGVGLLLAVDPILDMGRTAVNVAGQVLVPVIVAKREGLLDIDAYNAIDAGSEPIAA